MLYLLYPQREKDSTFKFLRNSIPSHEFFDASSQKLPRFTIKESSNCTNQFRSYLEDCSKTERDIFTSNSRSRRDLNKRVFYSLVFSRDHPFFRSIQGLVLFPNGSEEKYWDGFVGYCVGFEKPIFVNNHRFSSRNITYLKYPHCHWFSSVENLEMLLSQNLTSPTFWDTPLE